MSFLRNYLAYATNNEAPEMFHVWSGYACLSAAVSRRVWLPFGDEAIYPNLYVMLVGDAGNGKSHALSKAKRMLSELETVPISRSIETPEGLWRFMGGEPNANPPVPSPIAFLTKGPDGFIRECHPMTLIANEFVNFISQNQAGWTNALNDIYDSNNYEYRTKNKGEDRLANPYIVLLGALTTDISLDLQKAKIISSGFARRTIFHHGERKWHVPHAIPQFTEVEAEKRAEAVDHLRLIQKVNGGFIFTPEAQAFWINWYNTHSIQVPQQSPQLRSWYASKPHQVLKLAMLTSLSEDLDLVLLPQHIQVALDYLGEMELSLYKIFGGVGRNELASVAMQIFTFLEGQPEPISRRKLKALFWNACKPPTDFDECINYLLASGKIKESLLQVGLSVEPILGLPDIIDVFARNLPIAGLTNT